MDIVSFLAGFSSGVCVILVAEATIVFSIGRRWVRHLSPLLARVM